jgi:UDP-2,3-diacylglucosamine pyrophosphatase LpxH
MLERLFNSQGVKTSLPAPVSRWVIANPLHPIVYDAIIISDIHFGSPMCLAQELDEFLGSIRVKYLILAGDVFDDLKFNRLQHWHWQALSRIRKISDHCQVIWIRGNHDTVSAKTMSHLLGVDVRKDFSLQLNGYRFFVVHGDRWDTFIYKHQRTTEVVTWMYNLLMRLNTGGARQFSKFLKRKAKLLTRNSEAVQYGALSFAKKKGYDGVFCGHTHMATLTKLAGIVYGNDGTWQSDDPHFLGIHSGNVDLCRYNRGRYQIVRSEAVESSHRKNLELAQNAR